MDSVESYNVSQSFMCSPDQCLQHLQSCKKTLNILHVNIRSVNRNFDGLTVLLHSMNVKCDIVILSECWLSKTTEIPILDGFYSAKSAFANQNDGVLIYIRSELDYTIAEPVFQDANCLILKLDPDTVIVAIYRSPSVRNIENFVGSLNDVLSPLTSVKTVAVIGDLNINIGPGNNDSNSEEYLNVMAFHGLLPAHLFPTRMDNCLDHVFLKTNKYSTALVLDSFFTDHAPVLLCLETVSLVEKPKSLIRQINLPGVISFLEESDFSSILNSADPNQSADLLISIISKSIDEHSKLKRVPHRKRIIKPWITPGLLRCIRNRDKLHLRSKQDPENHIVKLTYSRYRNYCNNLLKTIKCNYNQQQLERASGDPKATWDIIKSITYKNTTPESKSRDLLKICSDPDSSVNAINNYFANVGGNLAHKIQQGQHATSNNLVFSSISNPQGNSLVLLETDFDEIDRIISELKYNCAVGYDGIPASVIKAAKHVLIPPITHVCNLCLTHGIFPKSFKKALVTPIFKGGEGDRVESYRPISVLTTLSKILEKILNKRLLKYLDYNDAIAPNQYGFRKGKSTEDAVLELSNHIAKNLDTKKKTIGIFLDLAKAFDTVSTSILLQALETLGIRETALNIFRDYLSERSQRVRVGSYTSNEEDLFFGVPQGSVLGPTLFLVYVNRLCQLSIPYCKILVYADDTALIISGDTWASAHRSAEHALGVVMNWLSCNLLTLNVSKTHYVTFSANSSTQPNIPHIKAHGCSHLASNTCDCPAIHRTSCVKYLGVYIDCTLSWNKHIDVTVSRVRKLMFPMKKLRAVVTAPLLKTTYYALAQSILTYCIPVWGGTYKTLMLRLERAQRAVLKVMLHKPYRYSTNQLYRDLSVLTVRQLCALHVVLRTHSSLSYDPELFTHKRRKDMVCPPMKTNTALASRHFPNLSGRLYNALNKVCKIYPLPKYKCKKVVSEYLQGLTYDETETLFNRNI